MIVERNEFGDIKWIEDDIVWAEFVNGRHYMYKPIERGLVGYTIKLRNHMSTTWINLQSQDESFDTINNHLENLDDIKKLKKLTDDYLGSDAGAWGRGF